MDIDSEILKAYGASFQQINKGEVLFREGDSAKKYFQIVDGSVRVISNGSNGREHFHRLCLKGQCFGVSALYTEQPYAVTAIASQELILCKISSQEFN